MFKLFSAFILLMAASASEPDTRESSLGLPPTTRCDLKTKLLLIDLMGIVMGVEFRLHINFIVDMYFEKITSLMNEKNIQILRDRAMEVYPEGSLDAEMVHHNVEELIRSVADYKLLLHQASLLPKVWNSPRNLELKQSVLGFILSKLNYIIPRLDCSETLAQLHELRREEILENIRQKQHTDKVKNSLMRNQSPDDSSGGRSRRHRRSKKTSKSKRSKQMSRFRKKRSSLRTPLDRTVLF